MQCFLIPKKICETIDKKQIQFWLGQKDNEKKINWVKWNTLRKNKGEWGMRFRDLHTFNKTLLAKQA